jgi:integrase
MTEGTALIEIKTPADLLAADSTPPALFLREARAAERFFDFFTANIQNKHTRRAYFNAACRFSEFCAERGVHDLARVKPVHVAGYIESLREGFAKPTTKQHLAAIRMLFDWLVVGQIIELNPAHAVRGPKHVVTKGRTPVLNREEARALLSCIDTSTLTGLRDRRARKLRTTCRAAFLVVRPFTKLTRCPDIHSATGRGAQVSGMSKRTCPVHFSSL